MSPLRFACALCLYLATSVRASDGSADSVAVADPAALAAREATADLPDGLYAVLDTRRGVIVVRLEPEESPLGVAAFVGLAEGTLGPVVDPGDGTPPGRRPFYDGLGFHRVVPGFVVQGGDPNGDGTGGPGFTFEDEFSPRLSHDAPGVLAWANSGADANGSQFYLTLAPVPRLDFMHVVLGRTVRGSESLPRLRARDRIASVRIVRRGEVAARYAVDEAGFAARREAVVAARPSAPAPEGPAAFVDEARTDLAAWYPGWTDRKLRQAAAVTGRTVRVRIVRRLPAPVPPLVGGAATIHETIAAGDPGAVTIVHETGTGRFEAVGGPAVSAVRLAAIAAAAREAARREDLAAGLDAAIHVALRHRD